MFIENIKYIILWVYSIWLENATVTNATNFRPINADSNPQFDSFNQFNQEHENVFKRAESASSTNSSDSTKQRQRIARTNNPRAQTNHHQGLPLSTRTKPYQNGSSINEQILTNKSTLNRSQDSAGRIRCYFKFKILMIKIHLNSKDILC